MKFGFGKIGQNMRTNIQGMSDPAGAASKFSEMAKNTSDPAKAAKYEQLADQWNGTAMQGGFFMAMNNGGLGVPGTHLQQEAQQQQQLQSQFMDSGSTNALAAMYGQGNFVG